jgi:hypothetical protein
MTSPTSPIGPMIVPRRFCGPPSSGNGGWSAGALAATLPHPDDHGRSWPAVTVALRQPPPLDVELPVTDEDGTHVAWYDDRPVAQARFADRDPAPVAPVGADEARAAEAGYPGLRSHPFPTCFACGTDREEGDGLRIFPGEVSPHDETARAAATWTPHRSLAEDWHEYRDDVRHASLPVTWAALDCVGAWAGDMGERPMVLGTMTARIEALPVIGEEHVVIGAARGQEGRKTFTASTLYDADGRIVATAAHVWISIDPAAFA